MYGVSDTFLQALRRSHAVVIRVDAYHDGDPLLEDIEITGGAVTVNPGTGVRRTLDCTIADAGLWSTLDVIGVELRPYRGIRYPDGSVETVPLGVFQLDAQSMQMAPGGIQVRSAPDRWAKVQRAQFETPEPSVRTNTIKAEALRLVADAVDFNTAALLTNDFTPVGAIVWDRDRAAAATDLATSIACDIFFDVDGDLVIRDAPHLSATPVWTIDASASGVMLGGELARDRSRTYNVVIASMGAVDGRTPFPPQKVEDSDPTSRTFTMGPFGRVPYFYSSPTLRSAPQALTAARALLNRLKAINAQFTLDAVCNPALDRGDVITVLTPTGINELHMIDSMTIPLDVGGPQRITTKSSRPEGDVPEGE
jgi:hypothetical protein